MGYYINPENITKEAWLAIHGDPVNGPDVPQPSGQHFVCLVDNGWMTAAAIAYCDEEAAVFAREDGRPKQWFLVDDSNLEEVEPNVKGKLE